MDLSIIILNYKTKGLVLNCLKSIKEADLSGWEYEIIVVDNNSQDNLGPILTWQYPQVKFIQNRRNLGMGAGNNVGLKRARGDYVIVMNPDTMVLPETFKTLYNYLEQHPQVGLVGPRQFNPDQSVQDSCYRWHKLLTPIYRRTQLGRTAFGRKELDRFLYRDLDKNIVQTVDWLLGSFLMARSSAWQSIGLFDERFFLYLEDTDWCRRFWEKKWQVVYLPTAKIIHNHSRASANASWYKFFINNESRHHVASWLKYLLKWGVKAPIGTSQLGY